MTTQKAITQKNQPNREGLEEFKRNVKEFSQKNAAKTQQARPAQAEPEQVKTENPKLDYRPPQYEVTLSTVQALVSIMTGEPCHIRPHKVVMPENDYGPITLVLSSSHNIYYRVTPSSCTCQGWYFSEKKCGIGKCRHHTLAFPEQAGENCQKIADIKLGKQGREVKASTIPSTMPEKLAAVNLALKQGGISYKSIAQDVMGQGTIMIKMPYAEDLTPDQSQKMERALALGRAAAGPQVYVSAC
jgi:hypothetical protein